MKTKPKKPHPAAKWAAKHKLSAAVDKPKRKPIAAVDKPERVPVAEAKVHFSRYVRQVQESGRPITVTMHGRDAIVLAPIKTVPERTPLKIRPRLDNRSIAEIVRGWGPLPGGSQPSEQAVQEALDWTRADRF